MPIHLLREVDKLKKQILSLGAHVEENMRNAVKAVLERDEALAKRVIQEDHLIDTAEVDVEEECLKILALHQPVAHDLRYIVAMLKINHDLERISDLAVTIAKRAVALCSLPEPNVEFEISSMAEKTVQMVARSLDALINRDANLARDNWFSDDEVDAMCARNYDLVEEQIRKHPEHLSALLSLLNVSRNLERIADHATNISKDVIYMIEGEIVR
ncbi:MAG TPA: phosphate signaling complex protein PhoU, partial [Kiritimatiellia bacterium]|nr:phosphate signaling complex protein PhoU [Kiritimatiellia bacterium]